MYVENIELHRYINIHIYTIIYIHDRYIYIYIDPCMILAKVDLWKRNNNGLPLGRHTMN